MPTKEPEITLGGPEDEPEVAEQLAEVSAKVDEEHLNRLADMEKELAEKEAQYREKYAELEKRERQMQFWGDGGWQAMPEDQLFSLTIDRDRHPTAPIHQSVITGNENGVYKWDFVRGETYHNIPKKVLRTLDQAEVRGYYNEVEDGNKVAKETYFKRFDFKAIPIWD